MEQNQEKESRPDKVSTAVKLLYLSIAIGVVRSIFEIPTLTQTTSLSLVISVSVFTLAIMAFLIYMIGRGRNWARITFLVLFLIGLPFSVLPLLQSLLANPISGVLGLSQAVLQIIALVFLFQKPSSDWFKLMKAS